MFSLDGKVVLVTGSTRGLGWAMARALSEAGATVVLNGRSVAALQRRIRELAEVGGTADMAPFDVTDAEDGPRTIQDVAARHGRLDVLINNAGIILRKAFTELTSDDWNSVLSVNLTACFTLAQAAAAVMTRQGRGSIIMTASIVATATRPGIAAYTAAKGAVSALTRALAVELGPLGIRCNAIAPGYFRTEATEAVAESEFGRSIENRIPLRRWGEPRDLGGIVVFLASDAASYVNGAVFTVDGGLTAAL
jgi:gluconate 5-dehydrogenase